MLPSTITVLGMKFEIQYSDLTSEKLNGDSNIDDKIIRINSTLSEQAQKDTLFHECVHMAIGVAGLDNLITGKVEEAIVRCIEHAFCDWITIP